VLPMKSVPARQNITESSVDGQKPGQSARESAWRRSNEEAIAAYATFFLIHGIWNQGGRQC
jgi:hypothetical protein